MPHTIFPKARLQHRKFSALTLVNPQWLGSGDISVYEGAIRIGEFLSEALPYMENPVDPEKTTNDIRNRIISETREAYRMLKELNPDKLFTVGGSEEADAASLWQMAKNYGRDYAVIWLSPRTNLKKNESESHGVFRDELLSVYTGRERVEGYLPLYIEPSHLIHVGGRNFTEDEKKSFADAKIMQVSWEEDVLSKISDWLSENGLQKIYLHISLDALDLKAFTEGSVSLPEGITWAVFRDALNYLRMAYDIMGLGILDTRPESIRDERIMELVEFGVETCGFSVE